MISTQVVRPAPVYSSPPHTIGKLKVEGGGRMALVATSEPTRSPWSLNDLSSELLALIFEQLREINTMSLASARLLSKRFNAIITPIRYEHLTLTEQIIAPEAATYFPEALGRIHTLTRHVEIRSDLDPQGIQRLLSRIRRLLTVRWKYKGAHFRSGEFWIPSDVLNPQQANVNNTKIYIEDLPLRDFTADQQDLYLRTIPSDLLASLKLASPTPPLTNRLESLKQLILRSRHLETFHYQDRGQGTRFTFSEGEELPAFKELTLRSYDWNHTAADVEAHWDFSLIASLKLIDVPIFEFLTSVPFGDLVDLHTLHCEDFSAHLPDRRREATYGLYALIKQIKALTTLKITCHTQLFPMDGLLRHSKTLQVLKFCDYVGFSEDDRRCPTIWIDDLVALAQGLFNLHTLEMDMDVALCDPSLFLRALCQFPRLHTLTLHVQTVLRAFEVVHPEVDRDYEAAMRTFGTLVRGKAGSPWRCITINVGGWRRHMVRRLGEAWRAQNERGVYAERCFVLERNPTGGMTVREEMGGER
ncbi:hypothetical protein JX266_002815 [Neoarthrinium moseri]|nr:hypothetical protein JX266_002815 [Neoarthrinium moseri]